MSRTCTNLFQGQASYRLLNHAIEPGGGFEPPTFASRGRCSCLLSYPGVGEEPRAGVEPAAARYNVAALPDELFRRGREAATIPHHRLGRPARYLLMPLPGSVRCLEMRRRRARHPRIRRASGSHRINGVGDPLALAVLRSRWRQRDHRDRSSGCDRPRLIDRLARGS